MKQEEFRDLCRAYRPHMQQLNETAGRYQISAQEKVWLRSHVQKVDALFSVIEENYGMYARAMLWDYYVEGLKQPDIAYKYGIPLRTMQRKFSRWIRCVTGEEDDE